MTSSAPIGVVIATRDRAARLADTLDRLRALPEQPPVMVVDNGSRDRTAELVASEYPDVRLLRLGGNHGAVARNHGVRMLGTEYVAFCDDDSWWAPGSLADATELLDRCPRLGLIAAGVRVGPRAEPDPLEKVLGSSPLGTPADLPGRQVLGFLACAAVVRRRAYLEAGGFHPLLFFGAEETLLAYDLAALGWGVAHCPRVVAHHSPAPGERPGRVELVRRNELLTCWLRRPLPLAVSRTATLAGEARHDVRSRAALRGVLARLPAALRQRAVLPPHVERAARRVEGRCVDGPSVAAAPPPPVMEASPPSSTIGDVRAEGRGHGR